MICHDERSNYVHSINNQKHEDADRRGFYEREVHTDFNGEDRLMGCG